MAKKDLHTMGKRLQRCKKPPCRWWFRKIGLKHGIPPALLAAIASRESRGGSYNVLRKDGFSRDYPKNKGYGLMQLDLGSHPDAPEHRPFSYQHIDKAAAYLSKLLVEVEEKFPDWNEAWQLRGMLVAYNAGIDDVRSMSERIDYLGDDSPNDYSSDIWQRARHYALHHQAMLGKHCRRKIPS
jgi:soluble lytic murein transglycosylase-like protein